MTNEDDSAGWWQEWTTNHEICLFGLGLKNIYQETLRKKNWTSSIAANSSALRTLDLTITGRCC